MDAAQALWLASERIKGRRGECRMDAVVLGWACGCAGVMWLIYCA